MSSSITTNDKPKQEEKSSDKPKVENKDGQQQTDGQRSKRDMDEGNVQENSNKSDNNSDNNDDIGTCFGSLDEQEARKLKQELDRAKEESQSNYNTNSRCEMF